MLGKKRRLFFAVVAVVFGMNTAVPAYGESAREYYEGGLNYMSEEKYDEAVVSFEKAIALNPRIAQLHHMLGLAHLYKKKSAYDALSAFEEAVHLDPSFSDAYYNLGIIYSGLIPDFRLAEEYYLKAIETDPNSASPYFGMGWLKLIKMRDPEAAQPYLETSVRLNPEHAESQYFLGVVHILNRENPKALKPLSFLRSQGRYDLSRALEAMLNEEPETVHQQVLERESKGKGV